MYNYSEVALIQVREHGIFWLHVEQFTTQAEYTSWVLSFLIFEL